MLPDEYEPWQWSGAKELFRKGWMERLATIADEDPETARRLIWEEVRERHGSPLTQTERWAIEANISSFPLEPREARLARAVQEHLLLAAGFDLAWLNEETP